MKLTGGLGAAVCVAAMMAVAPALAAPITYSFSGRLSGSLDGTGFALAPVTFIFSSDTDTVFQPTPAVRPTLYNTLSGVLGFSVAGTAGTFDAPYNVFSITQGSNGVVGFTETGSNDLIDVRDPALAGYDLRGPAGPVTNQPIDFLNFDTAFATSRGELVLFDDDDASVTFTGLLGGTVPEPETWSLMIAGFGMIGIAARRRAVAAGA